jgi:lycopene beta-cyclase
MQRYDYIIAGAGCAGLSLMMRMLDHPFFASKSILLVDKAPKSEDDRTWCFWEKNPGFFEPVVYHQWPNLWVKHKQGSLPLKLNGYRYKMIRGIDFYRYCFKKIEADKRVEILYGHISHIDAEKGRITLSGKTYEAVHIFSSLTQPLPPPSRNEYFLLQHFRGWWIATEEDVFDPGVADLMNFKVSQKQGCTFVYVMPVSPRKALIEYTLFSEKCLTQDEYDEGLKIFIEQELNLNTYTIADVEQGVIPMTNQKFPTGSGKLINIGTSGGRTKGSTGYTFQNIQKHSDQIIEAMVSGKISHARKGVSPRFSFYDSVLLRVLSERKISGADVFFRLFQSNPADRILRFLDDETSPGEELLIMNSAPKLTFTVAAMKQLV